MPRVLLVHWNADEAKQRLRWLAAAGYAAEVLDPGGMSVRQVAAYRPAAIVIDLSRLPSHGRAVAMALCDGKATRAIPQVFVGGTPDRVEKTREIFPDATYCEWTDAGDAIRRAIAQPPRTPPPPRSKSGPSGTPLPRKLGIKPNTTVMLLSAPAGFAATLGGSLLEVELKTQARGKADLVLLFVASQLELVRRLPGAQRALAPGAALWVMWPKQSSGVGSDLSSEFIRRRGLANGLVNCKVAAIDSKWSGLKFAVKRRSPAAPKAVKGRLGPRRIRSRAR